MGKSYALRLLIHFLGDQSQPLHNLNMVNATYPDSDSGGNAISVKKPTGATVSLHSVWDQSILKHTSTIRRPFDGPDGEKDWATFITEAREVKARHSI